MKHLATINHLYFSAVLYQTNTSKIHENTYIVKIFEKETGKQIANLPYIKENTNKIITIMQKVFESIDYQDTFNAIVNEADRLFDSNKSMNY